MLIYKDCLKKISRDGSVNKKIHPQIRNQKSNPKNVIKSKKKEDKHLWSPKVVQQETALEEEDLKI